MICDQVWCWLTIFSDSCCLVVYVSDRILTTYNGGRKRKRTFRLWRRDWSTRSECCSWSTEERCQGYLCFHSQFWFPWFSPETWITSCYYRLWLWTSFWRYEFLICVLFFSPFCSPVQHECIPQAILGMDILCQAKSGMGKTAVFVLATLQQIDPVDGQVCKTMTSWFF